MKKIAIQEAVGLPLCHDMTAIRNDSGKETLFRRGHVLREEDIPVLLSMGKTNVFVGNPEAGQIHEDEAGLLGAKALAGPGITFSGPQEGRFRLFAETDGLFTINRSALLDLNAIPDYTAATIPHNTPVRKGHPVAGVRIVPLVTQKENVEQVQALLDSHGPILTIRPYLPLRAGLIITGTEVYTGRVEDLFEPVLRGKMAQYGAKVLGLQKCPDDPAHIQKAAEDFLEQGADLILFTGGMSVDPDDVTPLAIRKTGAVVVSQGLPMQPGNMLMLAYLEDTALIGVPGAAMHRKITSLDVILPRIFTGETLKTADLLQLGEGGLCLDCTPCGYPACYFGRSFY